MRREEGEEDRGEEETGPGARREEREERRERSEER